MDHTPPAAASAGTTSPGLTYPPPRAGTCSEPGMATAPPLTSWPKLFPYPLSGFQAAGWPPQTLLGCHSPKPTKNCQKSTCGRRIPPIPKKSGEHREKALNPTSAHRSLSSLRANRNHGCSRHSDVSLSPNNCHDALVVAGGICVWAGRSPSPANTTTAGVDSSNLGWSRTGTDRPFPPAPSAESSSPTVSSMPS